MLKHYLKLYSVVNHTCQPSKLRQKNLSFGKRWTLFDDVMIAPAQPKSDAQIRQSGSRNKNGHTQALSRLTSSVQIHVRELRPGFSGAYLQKHKETIKDGAQLERRNIPFVQEDGPYQCPPSHPVHWLRCSAAG